MSTPLDPKAKAYMLYLRGQGKNNKQISKIIGCGKATVQRYIGHSPFENPGRRAGWRIPDEFPGYGLAEQEENIGKEKIVKLSDLKPLMLFLRGLGMSYRSIGSKIGVSGTTIMRYIGSTDQEEKEEATAEQEQKPERKIIITRVHYKKAT